MKQISSLKKIFLSILLIFVLGLPMFSLPGYTELLPTESGEYVYYKDFTFAKETYIGFLYYSEDSIGVRCFSNGNFDVTILFSLDKSKDYIELTGERIVTQVTPKDVEIVNYIHDMVYELSSRRKKVQNEFLALIEQKTSITKQFVVDQDFVQFGGQVQLVFDGSIPVFNLESITDFSGKKLLQAVTMGTLSDSADTSFEKFAGFEFTPLVKEVVKNKKLSRKEQKLFEETKQVYDSSWQKVDSMPGEFKTLGDVALYWEFPLEIVRDTSKNESSKQVFDYFSRNNRLSANGTYVYLPESSVTTKQTETGKQIQVSKMMVYNPEGKKYSVNYKILVENNGFYRMIHFTAYESWLMGNQNQYYVDYIINSIN
jgi:hypothetical protein